MTQLDSMERRRPNIWLKMKRAVWRRLPSAIWSPGTRSRQFLRVGGIWARRLIEIAVIGLFIGIGWRCVTMIRAIADPDDTLGFFGGGLGAFLAVAGSAWLSDRTILRAAREEADAFRVLIGNLERALLYVLAPDEQIIALRGDVDPVQIRLDESETIPASYHLLIYTEIGKASRDWKIMASVTRLTRELRDREERFWDLRETLRVQRDAATLDAMRQEAEPLLKATRQLLTAVEQPVLPRSMFVHNKMHWDSMERHDWRVRLNQAWKD